MVSPRNAISILMVPSSARNEARLGSLPGGRSRECRRRRVRPTAPARRSRRGRGKRNKSFCGA
jgi:hypothetical protein